MHQVKLRAIPCFLIETGCKCKKKLVSMTTTRLRRSTGAGCRMMLFQICDSRMISPSGGMEFKNQRTEEPKNQKGTPELALVLSSLVLGISVTGKFAL